MRLEPTASEYDANPVLSVTHERAESTSAIPALSTRLNDVSFSSAQSSACSEPTLSGKTWSIMRFIYAVLPSRCNTSHDPDIAAKLAFGRQVMNDAMSLNASIEHAGKISPPTLRITNNKYALGAGLLMFGSRDRAQGMQSGLAKEELSTNKPYREHREPATRPYHEDIRPTHLPSSREERALNFIQYVKRDLDSAFYWADLPKIKKKSVMRSVLNEYRKTALSKKNKIDSQGERLIALDLILLRLGETSGRYQRDFQLLGEGIRELLRNINNSAMVRRYLLESSPHVPVRIVLDNPERVLDDYFEVFQQHEIQTHSYFSEYSNALDDLIIHVCQSQFPHYVKEFGIPSLNETFNVEFVKKYLILIFRPYITQSFTAKEIFLGVHKRYAVQESMVDIEFPRGTHKFITSVLSAQPDVTDFIERELFFLYKALKENAYFEYVYKQSLNYRMKGIVINYLDAFENIDVVKQVHLFLNDKTIPHVATLFGKVIPNVFILTDPISFYFVMISLSYSELKIFKKNVHYDELGVFVLNHLSVFDQQRVNSGSINIHVMCDAGIARNNIYKMYCEEDSLGHEYSLDYRKVLYEALLHSVKSNINAMTYTDAEYLHDNDLATLQNLIFKIDCIVSIVSLMLINPLTSALLATVGVGSGMGSIVLNNKIMKSTDNGVIYENALSEARIGAWFTVFGVALDVGSGTKLIANSFKAYKSRRLIGLGKTSLTSPHVSQELKGMIKPQMYDSQVPMDRLSAPDARGLQWSAYNVSYLKINNNYIKVVKAENNEIYYVGKYNIATRFTHEGEFKPLPVANKKSIKKGIVSSRYKSHFYKESPDFTAINIPKTDFSGEVGYRSLGDNHYIQFYTRSTDANHQGSKVLVISAHGGYFRADMRRPAVLLPPDTTIKFLSPHDTALEDPGLNNIVNAKKNIVEYLSIYNNNYKVQFIPQFHREWLYSERYNPIHPLSALGRQDGVQNYRHAHFASERPKLIAKVIAKNRKLAAKHQAALTDVLIVNNKIESIADTDLFKASVQRVFELDQSGELVNEVGERYNTFVFSHCRSNLAKADSKVSLYRTYFPSIPELPAGAFRAKVILTLFHRDSPQAPFAKHRKNVGEMAFVPVSEVSA